MIKNNDFKERRAEIFSDLLIGEWNGKKIWEHIRDEELIATPAFEGRLYKDAKTKVMFVGRDLNGWDEQLRDCSSLDNTVDSIINQTGACDTFINKKGYGDSNRKYYHKNSKFFRCIKHVLENLGESDVGIDETWYSDSKEWNQKFVWANLYCISPKRPRHGDNIHPDNAMVKLGIDRYVDLMELYISYYEPDVVVFITDLSGWFIRWKRKKSFKDIVCDYQEIENGGVIAAKGVVGKSRIFVCRRPDRRNYSYRTVECMAKTISEWILNEK